MRAFLVMVAMMVLAGVPAMAAPRATPQATPAAYPPLAEVRDLWVRPWALQGMPFTLAGEVEGIRVAPEGYGFTVGDDAAYRDTYRTVIVLRVALPHGPARQVMVVRDADVPGVYPGDRIAVGGVLVGTETTTNAMGTDVTVPLMIADRITLASDATPVP